MYWLRFGYFIGGGSRALASFHSEATVRSHAPTPIHDADGVPGLLVKRFDRMETGPGAFVALAQEDGCQVLGRYTAEKYRVTTEEVIGALAGVCPVSYTHLRAHET